MEEFRMTVHLFGATSSPSIASYALKRTAEDHKDIASPEAVQTVLNNFYVDDCLKSVPTEDDAMTLAKDLRTLCASGGFTLTKWTSHNRKVLMSIPEEQRAKETNNLDLSSEALPVERERYTVGYRNRCFHLQHQVARQANDKKGNPGRRQLHLRPLGLLAPVIRPLNSC
ncbi:hypothetical protein AAFF_G00008880 [Aldrovandia affinis]|uniref:Uncharacterized protein n=1 Tax=Aldrovandia affinis TaxID=143900 RepID=A0AAD7T6D8_9TELE|nr:hypothetical protein AAFF_G00008880 [Aldrovandia affinis]